MTGGIGIAVQNGRSGVGYNWVQLRSSQLTLLAGSFSEHMVTNDPILVYWVSGRQPILGNAALSQSGDLGSAMRESVASGAVTHYVYFFNPMTSQGVSKEDLSKAGIVLHEEAEYPDGTLYQLTVGPMS